MSARIEDDSSPELGEEEQEKPMPGEGISLARNIMSVSLRTEASLMGLCQSAI